jgi:hypothetical protein
MPTPNILILGSAVDLGKIDEIDYTGKDEYEQRLHKLLLKMARSGPR